MNNSRDFRQAYTDQSEAGRLRVSGWTQAFEAGKDDTVIQGEVSRPPGLPAAGVPVPRPVPGG